jgi:hypothetical protein
MLEEYARQLVQAEELLLATPIRCSAHVARLPPSGLQGLPRMTPPATRRG